MIEEISAMAMDRLVGDMLEPDAENQRIIRVGGQPIAVFGISVMGWGLASVYGHVDTLVARNYAISLTRETKELIKLAFATHDLRQLRALVLTHEQMRWAEIVGFEAENIWKRAGPAGQDAVMMLYERRH